MDVPPNQSLYINNLNEKVKKEGKWLTIKLFCIVTTDLCRIEEVAVRHFLSVWADTRHCGSQDTQDERTSIRGVL